MRNTLIMTEAGLNSRVFQRPVCSVAGQTGAGWTGGGTNFPTSQSRDGQVLSPGTPNYGEFVPGMGWWCRPPEYNGSGRPANFMEPNINYAALAAETGLNDPNPNNNVVSEHRIMNWRTNSSFDNLGNPEAATPSSDTPGNGGNGDGNWVNDFPNGYYTCRPSGCCINAPGSSTCTPFN
ncbi:MAG: hypothetical protein HRT45_03390 [Bdellovibrionales bacterium]|nr:hypothetical protein [Bdellovibrionales bacterium]